VDQYVNDIVHWQTRRVSHEADFTAQRFRRADVTCEQVTTFIADYLAGELNAATTLAVEQHLQGCSDCLAFLNTYRKTVDTLRSLRDADIPPELQERVRRFLSGPRFESTHSCVGNFFRRALLKQARDKITAGCSRAMDALYRGVRQQIEAIRRNLCRRGSVTT
jgi:hypothetical protein